MSAPWSHQPTDSGRLLFHRDSGLNILLPDRASQRTAPRVLQIGLLTPCNLSCHFCYRDTSAPSRLTADFLSSLLKDCAEWGVLEVAFGGGEPLLFKGFPELVQTLTRETTLGINFTTNGMLLTDAMLARFGTGDWKGEIRLSAYPDNHYRQTLRRLKGRKIGLNWLLTPRNLPQLEAVVHDALALGADNVMLLGYKGPDPAMHLNPAEMGRLAASLRRLVHLPVRLDICWHPDLADVPQLFRRSDCGAGDEILVITPDRALQPCSFHHERVPFETFADLRRIYQDFRTRKPAAQAQGCSRDRFVPAPPLPANAVFAWHAHAGNNSGDTTIIGRFRTADEAQKAAAALRELAVAHERWIIANIEPGGYPPDCSQPSPPMLRFAKAHGFTWPEDEGLWWEEQACGAPNLTTAAIGCDVVIYHRYCMGFDDAPFADFFAQTGAEAYISRTYDRPLSVIAATGDNEAAAQEIRLYLEALRMFDHPSESQDVPPWGSECNDPRVEDDTDKSAQLAACDSNSCEFSGGMLRLKLAFENCFAGPLALIAYLERHGFRDIELRFEADYRPLKGTSVVEPKTGLFPDYPSPVEHLAALSPLDLWREILSGKVLESREASTYLVKLPLEQVAEYGHRAWLENPDAPFYVVCRWIDHAGPHAATWAREYWETLVKNNNFPPSAFSAMLSALPIDEVLELALKSVAQMGETLGNFLLTLALHLDHQNVNLPSRTPLSRFLDAAEAQLKQTSLRRKIQRYWGSADHFEAPLAELRDKLAK